MVPPAKKRNDLSLNDKHEVLMYLAAKVSRKEICAKYAIANNTVSRILKNKEKIEAQMQSHNGVSDLIK